MRTKFLSLLLLAAVMSVGFGVAFAADTETADDTLSVVSVGWGSDAESAKVTGINGIDGENFGLQIWFSEPIRSANVGHLLSNEGLLAEEVTQSALNYVLFNGKTLGELFETIKGISGATTDVDQILQMHVQGASDNLQFQLNKDNAAVAEGKYAAMAKCFFNLDGSNRPSDDNMITVKAGFTAMGRTVKEDVTFVYVPDSGNGRWVADTAEAVEIVSVTAEDNEANNEIGITIDFDKYINKDTVNHMARESEATVIGVNGGGAIGQAKLDNIKNNGLRQSVWNKLAVNGRTIWQLMQDAKVNPPEGGDVAGAIDVHVKAEAGQSGRLEIKIKKGFNSSVALEDGLTVAFLTGFRSDLVKFTEDVVYTYTDGLWAEEGEVVIREELGVRSVSSELKGDTFVITLSLDQAINRESVVHMARDSEATVVAVNGGGENGAAVLDNIKANGLRESVWNHFLINGRSVRELMDIAAAGGGSDPAGEVDVHLRQADSLSIEIKTFSPAAVDQENLSVTLQAGFHSDLVTVSEDITFNYIDGSWYAEGEEPIEKQEVTVANVSQNEGATDLEITLDFSGPVSSVRALHMARESEATVIAVNGGGATGAAVLDAVKAGGLRDSVWHKLAINGKTVWELMQDAKIDPPEGGDITAAVDVHAVDDSPASSLRIVLKNAFGLVPVNADGSIAEDITVTVMAGFVSDVATVSEDITYTFNAEYRFWLAPGEELPSFDPVELVGLEAPIMKPAAEDKNVEFVMLFSEEITNRQHAYISMPADFVGSFVGSSGDYSAAELTSFTKYGVFDTMAKNILLNGISVYDMMKSDPDNYPLSQQPNIAVSHAGQGGQMNALRLVIGGEHPDADGTIVHRPYQITDLNQNFVITIKQGLRTPLGQEVKEDVSFIYDYVTSTWYPGDSVEDIPVSVTVTFMDGETVLSTQECLKGEVVAAGIARKEGFVFEGWYLNAELTEAWDSSLPVEEDLVVYAKFVPAEEDPSDPPRRSCNGSAVGGSALLAVALTAAAGICLKRRGSEK